MISKKMDYLVNNQFWILILPNWDQNRQNNVVNAVYLKLIYLINWIFSAETIQGRKLEGVPKRSRLGYTVYYAGSEWEKLNFQKY